MAKEKNKIIETPQDSIDSIEQIFDQVSMKNLFPKGEQRGFNDVLGNIDKDVETGSKEVSQAKKELLNLAAKDPAGNMTNEIQKLRQLGYKSIEIIVESEYENKSTRFKNNKIKHYQNKFDKELKEQLKEVIANVAVDVKLGPKKVKGIDDGLFNQVQSIRESIGLGTKPLSVEKKDLPVYDKYLNDVFKHKPDQEVKLDSNTNRDKSILARAARVVTQAIFFPITALVNHIAKSQSYPTKQADRLYISAIREELVENMKQESFDKELKALTPEQNKKFKELGKKLLETNYGQLLSSRVKGKEYYNDLPFYENLAFVARTAKIELSTDEKKLIKLADKITSNCSKAVAKYEKTKEYKEKLAIKVKEKDGANNVQICKLKNGNDAKYKIHKVDNAQGTVIYFHGNGDNLNNYSKKALNEMYPNHNVIVMAYPGYSGTKGPTNRESIESAVEQMYNHIKTDDKNQGLFKVPIISSGLSVGGYYAAKFANDHSECKGLMLQNTYSNTTQTKGLEFASGPHRVFSNQVLDTESVLKHMRPDMPVVISHGKQDQVFDHKKNAQQNYNSSKSMYKKIILHDGDHGNANFRGNLDEMKELQKIKKEKQVQITQKLPIKQNKSRSL